MHNKSKCFYFMLPHLLRTWLRTSMSTRCGWWLSTREQQMMQGHMDAKPPHPVSLSFSSGEAANFFRSCFWSGIDSLQSF